MAEGTGCPLCVVGDTADKADVASVADTTTDPCRAKVEANRGRSQPTFSRFAWPDRGPRACRAGGSVGVTSTASWVCAICELAATRRPDDRSRKPAGPQADSGRVGGVQARECVPRLVRWRAGRRFRRTEGRVTRRNECECSGRDPHRGP